ncbi:tandem-95 repeat protein (plasmid) [Pseudomonas putida]|uniref:Ig-like domain-containing protein n=1 Tax=Pseudomonas putida TaxID=303 RepID=UPI001BAE8358|nr:Ig-like domain-containing protein [Pseudomonas putida]QUG93349.1 tandem-95 repeat protein [Pseudomonas putida]
MKPLLTLVMAAFLLTLGGNSAFAACTEQIAQFSVTPTNAYSDQIITVNYLANRTECSNAGGFSYPITIGGSSSAELGSCKGNRTKDTVQCTGDFKVPDGFTGALVVQVNGQAAKINVAQVNLPPVAQPQSVITSENTPRQIQLQATDAEGDEIVSYQLVKMPYAQEGDLSLTGSVVTFTPSKDWNGTSQFSFRVQDDAGNWSEEAVVTVTVNPANSPPRIVSKVYVGVEDEALRIVPLVIDPDGDKDFTLALSGDPATHGKVAINGLAISYVPEENWSGEDSFWITATDKSGAASEPTLIKVKIQEVNDPPVLKPITLNVTEDTLGTAPILFFDGDGIAPYTFSVVSQPAPSKGVCSVSGTSLYFMPAQDWVGTTTCEIVGMDSGGAKSKPATATITVTNVNDVPLVADVTATLTQGESRTLALSVTDPDQGDTQVIRLVDPVDPKFGAVSVVGKAIKVVLAPQFSGPKTIHVVAEDAQGALSPPATISLTVVPVNKAPVLSPVSLQTALDTPATIKLAASDPNNDAPLAYRITQNATADKGAFTLSGADLTFTPSPGFVGSAVAKVTSTDPAGLVSAESSVTVQVTEDQVVANDPDLGDTHSIVIVSQPPANVGTVTASGMKVSFAPVTGYFGSANFTYKVRDEAGLESAVTTGEIQVEKYNYAPTSVTGTSTVLEGESVSSIPLSVADPNPYDNGLHTFSVPVQSINGVAQVIGNTLTYQAPVGFTGNVKFDVVATDPGGLSVKGAVTVLVKAKNYAPTDVKLEMSTLEGTPVSGSPTVYDRNPLDKHTFKVLSQPVGGAVEVVSGAIKFTPQPGWTGRTSFDIEARDPGNLTVAGKGFVTVQATNLAPTKVVGQIRVNEGYASAPYYPLISDPNISDRGSHQIQLLTTGDHGSAVVQNNRIVYTPNAQYVGADKLRVRASDAGGLSVEGDISVEVSSLNQAPVSATLRMYAREGQPSGVTKPVINDVNTWDVFSYEVVTQPKYGQVVALDEGYIYTPNQGFYGNDTFNFRVIDAGGEYVEGVAIVSITLQNHAPTAISPVAITYVAGVGVETSMAASDPNSWDDFVFSVEEQPTHGSIWFDRNKLVYRTDGSTETTTKIRVTDQKGLFYVGTVTLKPRAVTDVIKDLPVVDLGGTISTPGITQPLRRLDGTPGFMVHDVDALSRLGPDVVAVLDEGSAVPLVFGGRKLSPGQGMQFPVEFISDTGLGTSIAAVDAQTEGSAKVLLVRADFTGEVYAVPVNVWKLRGQISLTQPTIIQALQRTRAQFVPEEAVCSQTVKVVEAAKGNVYDKPVCLLEFAEKLDQSKDLSSGSTLAIDGTSSTVGTQKITAKAYIVDENQQRYALGTYEVPVSVITADGAVALEPKDPFEKAYYKIEDLAIELTQTGGPACDLTIVERRAQSTAASYPAKPMCLVEWTDIPPGLSVRANWERPYLLGISQFLGQNKAAWKVSVFDPSGTKVPLGVGEFSYEAVEPEPVEITYSSKKQITERLFAASIAGNNIGDALIKSVRGQLRLKHNLERGKTVEETVAPAYSVTNTIYRRIYAEAFDRLWERRAVYVDAGYSLLSGSEVHSEIELLSVPEDSIMPIIDNDNGKILSTETLQVGVTIGDAYLDSRTYDQAVMGNWQIRLVTKPKWNTTEPLTDWVNTDAAGHSTFDLPMSLATTSSLRIYAEARIISPVDEYQVVRTSPKALSITVLNGAALDGTVRALRLTGEAPFRVTLFADVTNRAWAKDLGAVKWEMSTDGGPFAELPSTSKTPQRMAVSLSKGLYKVRAQLTNKNSGAISMTDEIELVSYNVPKALLKGPGNTFVKSTATFKVTQVDGKPIDTGAIEVQWSNDRGETWIPGTDAYSVFSDIEKREYVYVRLKFKDAPVEDQRVWKTIRSGVAFRKVRPPRVQLIGPRRPEVGKESVWVANLMMPYPNMDLTMDGEFINLNGEGTTPGIEMRYTPTDDDLMREKPELAYRAWINGYRDQGGEGITSQRITFWLYDWPEWNIQPTFSSEYAPADLKLRIRNVGEFKAVEGIRYDWEMPAMPGYEVLKEDSSDLRILAIKDPETYPFKVHVYDARGNYSLVERSMVFKEPPPWNVTLLYSGDNLAERAPLNVMVRPKISGGHPRDVITDMTYSLNGQPIETGGSRYARALLPTEGSYEIKLHINTVMSKAAEGEVSIDVHQNKKPTCDLLVKEGGSAWTATAICRDEDGRIARHNWFINDQKQGLGGPTITISKRTYPEAPRIELYATDDSGEDSEVMIW